MCTHCSENHARTRAFGANVREVSLNLTTRMYETRPWSVRAFCITMAEYNFTRGRLPSHQVRLEVGLGCEWVYFVHKYKVTVFEQLRLSMSQSEERPPQRRVGILDQVHDEIVEPLTRLRRGDMRDLRPAILIEPHRLRIARSIRLSSRLHPHNRVHIRVIQHLLVRRRPNPKARIADIAPLAPSRPDASLARAALVDDEVRWVPGLDEVRGELVDVVVLVPGVVPLGVGLARVGDVLVVVGDVDGEPADLGGGVDFLGGCEDFGVDLGGGREVVVPAEPAAVGSVDVERGVGELELRDGLVESRVREGGENMEG